MSAIDAKREDIRKSPPEQSETAELDATEEIRRRFDMHDTSIAAELIMLVTNNGNRQPFDGVGKALVATKRQLREILTVGEISEVDEPAVTELERKVIEAAKAWRRHPPKDWASCQTEIDLLGRVDALEAALAPPSLEDEIKALLDDAVRSTSYKTSRTAAIDLLTEGVVAIVKAHES